MTLPGSISATTHNNRRKRRKVALSLADFCVLTKWATIFKREAVRLKRELERIQISNGILAIRVSVM